MKSEIICKVYNVKLENKENEKKMNKLNKCYNMNQMNFGFTGCHNQPNEIYKFANTNRKLITVSRISGDFPANRLIKNCV